MPLRYRLPAYGGNAALGLLACLMLADRESTLVAVLLGALALLNLWLVRRLDRIGGAGGWLAARPLGLMSLDELRGQLRDAQARVGLVGDEIARRTLSHPGAGIPSGL